MNIFLSHARKDSNLALELAERLKASGLTVLHPEAEIMPGENWAKKIGKDLQRSEFMVMLLTPGALDADWLRKDIDFALGSKKFEGRVYSIFVGPSLAADKEMPWILLKLPHCLVKSAKQFGEVVKEIESMCLAVEESSSHA